MAKSRPGIAMQPSVYESSLERDGGVRRVREISVVEAIELRRKGTNVVVCGSDLAANRNLARSIERSACGSYKPEAPERKLGLKALPHFQPMIRGPLGHTFYETPKRKAGKVR